MKKIYFLFLALCFFNCITAQNIDLGFNQFNLPINHYFVNSVVRKSKALPNGKILLIDNENKLIRLNGNLLDTSFSTGIGFNLSDSPSPSIENFAIQSDGKIIVIGIFDSYNGQKVQGIIRLNEDGSIDTGFNYQGAYLLSNYGNSQIELQPDGKIIIIAERRYASDNLFRLNSNGSLDNSFVAVSGYEFGHVAIQSDGKLIVTHNTRNDYYSRMSNISRLSSDGTFDTTFITAEFLADITELKILNSGKIIASIPSKLVRLNTDGSNDTSFNIGVFYNSPFIGRSGIYDIIEQKDHKIIVCGHFTDFNSKYKKNIVRLDVDGSLDSSFADVESFLNMNSVFSISFFEDEKILASGDLGDFRKSDSYMVKINNDGSKDPSFNNICKGFFKIPVEKVVQRKDGKILVGGLFHSYNGFKCYGFTRLNEDGSLDETLTYGGKTGFDGNEKPYITAIAEANDGKTYIAGNFGSFNGEQVGSLIKINADGTRDKTFNAGNSIYTGIKDISVLENGNVLIAGNFNNDYGILQFDNSGYYSGISFAGNNTNCLKLQSDGKLLVGITSYGSPIKRFNKGTWVTDNSFIVDPLLKGGSVKKIEIQQDGKILLCGRFEFNGVVHSIVRILSSGSLDNSFNFNLQNKNTIVEDFTLLPNQTIMVDLGSEGFSLESRVIRLNNNGSIDGTFNQFISNRGLKFSAQSDGKILIYGFLSNSQQNAGMGISRLLGDDYYLVQGKNKIDLDLNGCDINDSVFTNLKLNISSAVDSFDYITNTSGDYRATLSNGSYTITPIFENPQYYNVSPKDVKIAFPAENNVFGQDFCITPNGIRSDLEITSLPLHPARPGFKAVYKISYKNKGNKKQTGFAQLTFDDTVLSFEKSFPENANIAGNKISWDFTDLKPFETKEIIVTLNVNSPLDTPAVNNGDILKLIATIASQDTDETPIDNTFTLNQTVVGSYDPNDKTCLEGDIITPNLIGEYVHYMIRFENTGTYAAQNIVVKDIIDLSKFDISTLIPTSSSHSFVTKISEGNKVEFIFENINLPFDDANNDGYVAFKIKTLPTLKVGDSFTNEANIYFDYNFPILTNKATSKFQNTLANPDFEFSNYFTLYPNPANDVLNINAKEDIEIQSLAIYDILGQLVIAVPNAKSVSTIDVSKLRTGIYFIKVKSDKGSSSMKFIKN